MMFGFGFLMMIGFILIPLALIGLGIVAIAWLMSQRQNKEEKTRE